MGPPCLDLADTLFVSGLVDPKLFDGDATSCSGPATRIALPRYQLSCVHRRKWWTTEARSMSPRAGRRACERRCRARVAVGVDEERHALGRAVVDGHADVVA